MKLLRATLYLQALMAFFAGILFVFLPGLLIDLAGIASPPEHAFMRLYGLQAVVLAMFTVLIAQNLDDHWWWSWAFVFGDLAVALFCVLKAAFGSTPGPTWPWWGIGLVHLAFGAVLTYAMGVIGTQRQPSNLEPN